MHKNTRCLPIVLALWPYAFFLLSLSPNQTIYNICLIGYTLLTFVVYAANIIFACFCKNPRRFYHLAFWDMIIKLSHIPFYLFTVGIGLLSLIAFVIPAYIIITPVLIITLFFVDLFLMLTSSAYGINAAIAARRKGLLSRKATFLHCFLHFIFVFDVVSSIILYVKIKKEKRSYEQTTEK